MSASDERRTLRVALGSIAALLLLTVLVFVKGIPGGGYELHGLFASSSQIRPGSDVRVAGTRVGEVREIGRGPGHTALVTMAIDPAGLPVHRNATLSIEPRLILEGNAYVRLQPGSPGAGELGSGETIPLTRTAVPVQLDQVLTTFDLPTRDALHRVTAELATALDGGGARGLRRAVRELDAFLPDVGAAADAARGQRAGDLPRAIVTSRDAAAALARDPAALAGLVTHLNRVSGAMAARDRELAATVRELASTLRDAPPALRALDAALPELARTGERLRPVLATAPSALRAFDGLLGELTGLVGRAELPALVEQLRPVSQRLPALNRSLAELLPQVTDATECLRTRVAPILKREIPDGANSTGDPVYLDLAHAFTGATGAAPSFDGNGVNVRAGVTEGATAIGGVLPGLGEFAAGGPEIQGVSPRWLGYGVEPAYRPDARCTEQPLADLGARTGGRPPTARDWARLREAGR